MQEQTYQVLRVMNNNVLLVRDASHQRETVLIGKGIGFQVKRGTKVRIAEERIEKSFYAYDEKTRNDYMTLIESLDDAVIGVCTEIILAAEERIGPISNRLKLVLMDHIGFAIERFRKGMTIDNPFTYEIKNLYPLEYQVGLLAQQMIHASLGIQINDDEVCFIALHLSAAKEDRDVRDRLRTTQTIQRVVALIERRLGLHFENDLTYNRLINHLRGSIERVEKRIAIENPLLEAIQTEFRESHAVACSVAEYLEAETGMKMPPGEIGYLALHIGRIKRILA